MPQDAQRPLFLRIDKILKPTSKYIRHQGAREKARRLKRLEKAAA